MPDEKMWSEFFDPESILDKLGVDYTSELIVDVGCGYGTFLIPVAKKITGSIIGIDIDQDMIASCLNKVQQHQLNNVQLMSQDISSNGYGVNPGSVDGVFLFNILHCEKPETLLQETYNVLKSKGKLYVIHWFHDRVTPRGPSHEIRPSPDQIISWAGEKGFSLMTNTKVEKYHYGLVFSK